MILLPADGRIPLRRWRHNCTSLHMKELPLGNLSVRNRPGDCLRWGRRNSPVPCAFNAKAEFYGILRDGHGCGGRHGFAAVVPPRFLGPGCVLEVDGYGVLRPAAGPGIDSLP